MLKLALDLSTYSRIRHNKTIFSGLTKIFSLFKRFIKTPAEKELLEAQTDKIKNEIIIGALETIAKERSLKLESLQKAIELFEAIGYTEDKRKKLVGPKIEKLIETSNALDTLDNLVKKGVILNLEIMENEADKWSEER